MGRSSARNRRSDAIAALIATAGSVRLRDLAQELGVSEMTLRRDAQFPDAGFACLGGYVVSASAGGAGAYDFDHALRRQVNAKRAAARQVLALLRRVRVFVDCGSTTTHLASLLTADAGIAVITHSLPVAELLTGALAAIAGMLLAGRINAMSRCCPSWARCCGMRRSTGCG
ncbi:DeoR family transcriptional regulator [Paracoccus sphaerophysae]|uniref:DeoR family transcriptional regulator n=1 Tax=Paracoccus sphaerophysae TaxID=690417 RepID=UPI0006914C16|nr:DeoR family transcriptional regulator [Paracoccus sphaerophysae]